MLLKKTLMVKTKLALLLASEFEHRNKSFERQILKLSDYQASDASNRIKESSIGTFKTKKKFLIEPLMIETKLMKMAK